MKTAATGFFRQNLRTTYRDSRSHDFFHRSCWRKNFRIVVGHDRVGLGGGLVDDPVVGQDPVGERPVVAEGGRAGRGTSGTPRPRAAAR